MTVTINGTTGIAGVDGSAGTPAIQGGDTNTGMFFPAADTIAFSTAGTEDMRIDSSGNVGIGTASAAALLDVDKSQNSTTSIRVGNTNAGSSANSRLIAIADAGNIQVKAVSSTNTTYGAADCGVINCDTMSGGLKFAQNDSVKMTLDSSGNLLVGKTATDITVAGVEALPAGRLFLTASATDLLSINRLTNDGTLVEFRQANTVEGSISVSGTTVSYNGGHLSRWAQTTTAKDESLVKGTVLSNLDEMNVYTDSEGNPVDNEQLNKVKVSDVEGDANVAGVFVNWTHDDAHDVDEINMAMTGDMIIRIAQGTTVQRGDLLMSAGDGTAKPQGDDIVRSKTVAKVTSTHVTCTYADGSFCVPCVLMAC